MEVDINTSLSDLKSLDNEKFKNLCEKYGLQIKGGLNTAMKNIKAKILLRKMQESFKENSLPGEETAPSDLQPTKPKKFPESPAMNLESLMDLPTEQLRTILGQHGIEVQGGLNPAVKRLKIKKLLARLDSGGAQVQAEQPKFVKPKLAVTKPVKFSDFDSSDEEPARLDVNSNRFFAIKATGNDDKTTPERPNNKTSYLDEKEVNSYIFNEIQPALSRLKELKNRNLTLSPRLPSYRSAVDYVKNENQRDFVSESSFKNNQTAPAKEIRMNMFPKMGNTDHNIISRFINDIDTFNQSEKSNLAYKNLKKFLTDNPNRLVDLGSNGPTILRPPLRHNAVHTACKEGKLAVLQLYFELLTDMKFMKTVFQNTTVDSFFKLSQELLINYFNDHDKLLAETPLHLACKNGQVATVEWLLYNCFMFDGDKWKRILDLSKVDKSGYTALELVNSRMKLAGSKFQSQYESICDIFENLKILKIEKNEIGKLEIIDYNLLSLPKNYIGPDKIVHLEFLKNQIYNKNRQISRPSSTSISLPNNLRSTLALTKERERIRRKIINSDYEKGLFNFTRKVCLENNTNLYEYWRFLDTTILWDIQDRQNLSFLELVETHLANKRSEIETSLPTSPDSNMTGDTEFFSADESLFSDNFEDAQNDTITDLCEQFEFVQLSSPKNKHLPKISVSECQSREFLGQPDESSFLTPTRPSFRKQRTKFFSASEKDTDPFSILPSAAKKLPYLFLETNDYYSKTDQQFYEALVQFFVDTEDLESLLSEKYPEIRHWYDHVKKNLMPDNQKVKNLRTPCRL